MVERSKTICWLWMSLILATGPTYGATKASRSPNVPVPLLKILFTDLCAKGCSKEEESQWRKNLRWEVHDLNKDSIPEYFLYIDHADWCGAGGSNCTVWVYQKRERVYKLLASETRLRPLKTYTNGYLDLYGDFRIGASSIRGTWEYHRTVYKFKGNQYKAHSEETVLKDG